MEYEAILNSKKKRNELIDIDVTNEYIKTYEPNVDEMVQVDSAYKSLNAYDLSVNQEIRINVEHSNSEFTANPVKILEITKSNFNPGGWLS